MSIMKLKHISLAIAGLGLSLGSCSKDFLEKEPSEFISPEQMNRNLVWNSNILLGQAAGATQISFSSGQATNGSHDDFSQKSTDLQCDILSGDMEVTFNGNYPWFESAANLLGTQSKQTAYSYYNWRVFYKIIFTTNGVFDTSGSDEDASKLQGQNLNYWGQSKVLRAYAYYNLINLYAKHYNQGANNQGIPIYRTAKSEVANKPSSVAEVYALILKDLQEGRRAMQDSGIERTYKSDIDPTVATGLLASVHLQMGNYTEAYKEAKSIIDGGKFSLLPAANLLTNGFNNVSHPEFIWAIDITKDNTNHLVTFWGHLDVFCLSYAAVGDYKTINQNLYDEIDDKDIRKQWFDSTTGLPFHKFFSELASTDPATRTKDFNEGNTMIDKSWTNDIVYLRLAEIYLIAAEAAARNNQDNEAKALLKTLYTERTDAQHLTEVTKEIDALSHDALLEKIYHNWRVEMWGEGRGLLTMKRFKKSVARSIRSTFYPSVEISYDDPRLTFEYPLREQQNNPNL